MREATATGKRRSILEKFKDYASRKFLLAVVAGTTATALQWAGKLDAAGSTYALIIVGTIGAYIAGNVAEAKK